MQFRVTLVRHGETDWNKNHLVQSFSDHPLNATGKEQAALLGKHLRHERFTKVYASDLIRTHETAEGILGAISPNGPFNIIKDVRLTEKNWGSELEGKCGKEFLTKALASEDPFKYTPPGAETYEAVRDRTASFFQELCKEFTENPSFVEENVLIVSSSGWMAHLLNFFETEASYVFVDEKGEAVTQKRYVRPLANTCVIKLEVLQVSITNWKVRMLLFNDTTHLEKN